jgi:hypothetical protein
VIPLDWSVGERCETILEQIGLMPAIGVEVGVFRGMLAARLLQSNPDLKLVMVDPWGVVEAPESYIASLDPHATLTTEEHEECYRAACANVAFAGSRAMILRTTSTTAAAMCQEGFFDFVFIDGDHSYKSVCADIDAWKSKIMPGGFIAGHDYANPTYTTVGASVKRAVDERFGEHVQLGKDMTWYVRL